ncbi:MAG: hypothetical protein AB8F34_04240 [Akkermansiaceae bacterium]
MRTFTTQPIIILLLGFLMNSASAQLTAEPPSERVALEIIADHESIRANLYQIIRITPGQQQDKDGFIAGNVIRVTAFAPKSAGRPTRAIKNYLMHYTEEYGWFLESVKEDARGIYLEISSQKKGRVFVR